MKIIFIFAVFFFCFMSTFSQTDSVLLNNYDKKVLEIGKLKDDLQTEKQKFLDLKNACEKQNTDFQNLIQELRNQLTSEKQVVADLNKNKIKEERDTLLTEVGKLNLEISKKNQLVADKDKEIAFVKANTKEAADKAKNDGKAEALTSIVNLYKSRSFDDLIKFSTKESVATDLQLVGFDLEIRQVLNDLQIYLNAKELLSKRFDAGTINQAKSQLSKINRQSKMLEALKGDIEDYKNFNTGLRETINNIIASDNQFSAKGNAAIQERKFNDIVKELTNYFYDYYNYARYPYLSNVVVEIVKRKKENADADVTDLMEIL